MNTPRDPHLPPPEVCDWLLSQEWSGSIPETAISYPKGNPTGICRSAMFDHVAACAAIGADEIGRVFLPVEALDVLRADQAARFADLTPCEQLADDIFGAVVAADLGVIPSINALVVAAALIAESCGLAQRTDVDVEVAP